MADEIENLIERIIEPDTAEAQNQPIQSLLLSQDTEELARLLESLPVEQRVGVWRNLISDVKLDVLVAMRADPRERILDDLAESEMTELLTGLGAEDLLELADSLSDRLIENALNRMDEQQREWFLTAQEYAEDLAGHWLNRELLALPQNAKVRDALRLLRRENPKYSDSIFLTNRTGQFVDTVRIAKIWQKPDHISLADLREEDDSAIINAEENAVAAAFRVQKSSLASLPVTDNQGKLLGRMDIGSACELTREYYEGQLMASAGMDEDEDLFSPVVKSIQGRTIWLAVNLLTAFAASWFIGLFEGTLQQVVALAILMPVVASMGGISGSQTLTLVIRGLALNQITEGNTRVLLLKELRVGSFSGILWAVLIGIIVTFWFNSALIGLVIGLAILLNIIAAAASGVLVPIILKRLNIDPALSGSVILTTVTDIVGFVAFLGIGTLILT